MSTESPIVDVRHLSKRGDDDSDGTHAPLVEDGHAPGAWPESVEVSYFADSAMTLPGMGERGANCGEWYPAEFCESCGSVHAGVSRCHQRGCPDCWATWTGNRAESIVRRLTAYRFTKPPGVERRVVHAVASPPPEEVRTLTDVRRYRGKAQERLKERGVRGGVMVFHGFRVKQSVKETYWELRDAEAVSGGLWQFVRENDRDWRSQTYWSPHFHVIGSAVEFDADDGEDGWVIRRLSSADPLKSLSDTAAYTSVAKMSRYILSHATFEPDGMRAVSWFGALHSTQFDPEEELSMGALATVERKAAEAVGTGSENQLNTGSVEEPMCEEDGCEGELLPIWDAGRFLMDMDWCESVGREAEHRLAVAFEWAIGERQPPPGMKKPRSRGEYDEAFRALDG